MKTKIACFFCDCFRKRINLQCLVLGAGENPVQIIYNNSESEQGKAAGQTPNCIEYDFLLKIIVPIFFKTENRDNS